MKRPGIGREVVIAAAISAGGVVLHQALLMMGAGHALRTAVLAALAAYAISLLRRSPWRSGRFTAAVATLTLPAAALLLDLSLSAGIALSLGWVWLLRCVLWHRTVLAIAADAGLTAAALALATAAASHTGSLFAGLWCLLFTQAFYVWIPPRWPGRAASGDSGPEQDQHRFDRAEQRADRALSQLFSNSEIPS